MLAYLSRYTHCVAISNSQLIKADSKSVTFRVKDCRRNGAARHTTMTLHPHEFIGRELIHVLPKGFTPYSSLRPVRFKRQGYKPCQDMELTWNIMWPINH